MEKLHCSGGPGISLAPTERINLNISRNIKRLTFVFLSLVLCLFFGLSGLHAEGKGPGVHDVFLFGAKGDGKSIDTEAIQSAIDKCHAEGGGKVYLHSGHFISGTVYLKSNVTLEIENGAVLKASNKLDDFPVMPSKYPSYTGEMVTNKSLIYAEDAKNIVVCGSGTIDGNGDFWVDGPYGSPSFSIRPRIVHFRNCENVRVRDVTLHNSASWVQSYQSCRDLVIDGITVDSRENKDIEKERWATSRGRNTDGLDLVDCQQVRISNCLIDSDDDAICLKSFSHDEACRDITITNCVISSNASGIKIGTETSGTFEDITIQNCVVYDTRIDAISIMTVDGARIERVNISNITARNIKGSAIFVRIGNRNRPYRQGAKINVPHLKDIFIGNVMGSQISAGYGCIIAGIPGIPIENVVLRDINLSFNGGGKKESSFRQVPEMEQAYPNGLIFGEVPAYGFFIRHAKNIALENITLSFEKEDQRPALLLDNVENIKINGLVASGTKHTPELVRLINSRDVVISESRSASDIPVFLSVYGDKSENIILQNNFLKKAKQKVVFEKESLKKTLSDRNPME